MTGDFMQDSINTRRHKRSIVQRTLVVLATCGMFATTSVLAQTNTLVRVATSYGDFTIELFDQQTPNTVRNFLGYVDRGDYSGSVFHRSVDNFVIQAGAYRWLGNCPQGASPGINCSAQRITQRDAVVNEPGISNTAGTLAMAKLEGNPNSATSQWFINVSDNADTLDDQNGGFTAFARILGEGIEVARTINGLTEYSIGGEAQAMPLRNTEGAPPPANGFPPVTENLVLINMHRVQRFSSAMHVFEYQTGILSTQVNAGDDLGRMSMLLGVVPGDDPAQTYFEIDPRSMVDLAINPEGMASFSSDDQRLRIPQVEINNNGNVSLVNNVVLRMVDEARLRFVLESYE